MFFKHMCDHEAFRRGGPGREGFGGFGPGFGRRGRGGGFGREPRMFDSGEMRLVILALIAEKPRHGYEVIKALSEKVGGDYSPSPGVVYPTLTLIEEMGYAKASVDEGGRKLYAITPEGQKWLDDSRAQVDAIFARFGAEEQEGFAGAGPVIRAMWNLRAAVKLRLRGRAATREQIQAIADALDAAAKTIERL